MTTLDAGSPAGLGLSRALAMVHIATHDAANGADSKSKSYGPQRLILKPTRLSPPRRLLTPSQ